MGIKSSLELLHVQGESLSRYVKSKYNYSGNDPEILKNYAALIAAKKEAPLMFFIPQVIDGELKYIPKNLPFDTASSDKEAGRRSLELRREGIRAEQRFRGSVPPEVAKRAGRAFRKQTGRDSYGFAELENIADRLEGLKPSTDPRYREFINLFESYYQAVERFAYEYINRSDFIRLDTFVSQAIDNAVSYTSGRKSKEERYQVVRDAARVLREHRSMLNRVLGKGGFLAEEQTDYGEAQMTQKANFEQVFASAKSKKKNK